MPGGSSSMPETMTGKGGSGPRLYTETIRRGAGGKGKQPGTRGDEEAEFGPVPSGDQPNVGLDKGTAGGPGGTARSAIGKALRYRGERWDELSNYLHDGNLCIDNNPVENAIRSV